MPTKTLEWYPLYEGYRSPLCADTDTGYCQIVSFGEHHHEVQCFKHDPNAMLYCQNFINNARIDYTPFVIAFVTFCDTLEQAKQAAEDYFAKT